MSDSSEDEDLSRFKEAVDTSFVKLIDQSRGKQSVEKKEKLPSERYLDVSTHYNDVKVPEEMQKRIGAKVSAIISKHCEFVNIEEKSGKKRKIEGGVKLFKDSEDFLSCEEVKDTYTESHNEMSKKIRTEKKRKQVDCDTLELSEDDKINAVTVSGDYVISREETKCWKSRRKEKLFKYKANKNSKILTAIE